MVAIHVDYYLLSRSALDYVLRVYHLNHQGVTTWPGCCAATIWMFISSENPGRGGPIKSTETRQGCKNTETWWKRERHDTTLHQLHVISVISHVCLSFFHCVSVVGQSSSELCSPFSVLFIDPSLHPNKFYKKLFFTLCFWERLKISWERHSWADTLLHSRTWCVLSMFLCVDWLCSCSVMVFLPMQFFPRKRVFLCTG